MLRVFILPPKLFASYAAALRRCPNTAAILLLLRPFMAHRAEKANDSVNTSATFWVLRKNDPMLGFTSKVDK
jgi:hypothetical protein